MINRVLHTIKKYNLIQSGDGVIVGLSGGPDSVCLLHLLYLLADELSIKIYAVHINHMLRGQESDDDEKYVRELCRKFSIPLHVKAYDVMKISKETGISLEEAGREIRYSEFEEFAHRIGATKIAVAHNKNDQAETIIMRIIRGTGLDGLKGMDHKRGKIIRPLLDTDRRDIERYCRDNALDPRVDSTNQKSIYTRNKVRLELIPYINRLFETDISESLNKMSLLLRDDHEYIEQSVTNLYNESVIKTKNNVLILDMNKLESYHPAACKRVIRQAVRQIKGNLKGIENVHIEDVVEMIRSGRTGAVLQLPDGLRISRGYGELKIFLITDAEEDISFDEPLEIPGMTRVESLGTSILASIYTDHEEAVQSFRVDNKSMEQFFDYDKLKTGINIRNRRNGDIFRPYKSNGTKKLKEFFIDSKIPREVRGNIPLIVKDNEVVWIVGYKISDKFKVTENTKSILKLQYL